MTSSSVLECGRGVKTYDTLFVGRIPTHNLT